jgi:hypothetical protein
MPTLHHKHPIALDALTLFLIFTAICAFAGAAGFLADLSGSAMQMPQSWLEGTPFNNYLVPALLLLAIAASSVYTIYGLWRQGGPVLFTRLTAWTHEHWAWAGTVTLGLLLVVWSALQYLMLQRYHPIQAVFALVGAAIIVLSLLPIVRRYYRR